MQSILGPSLEVPLHLFPSSNESFVTLIKKGTVDGMERLERLKEESVEIPSLTDRTQCKAFDCSC
jgi:hypothetical protein